LAILVEDSQAKKSLLWNKTATIFKLCQETTGLIPIFSLLAAISLIWQASKMIIINGDW
jgi:hypothetical protein